MRPVSFVRSVGPALTARTIVTQAWHTKIFLGLRADLTSLPEVRGAKVPITMEPRDTTGYDGFERELSDVQGSDYIEVLFRIWSCEAGVQTLYSAAVEGNEAYAQWLVRPRDQDLLHEHAPGRYSRLQEGEVLLEGAYTFAAYRRMGMMNDGMAQLLRIARDEGYTSAITYVGAENAASLRGCANVGFMLDHARYNERRLGRRRSLVRPSDAEVRQAWASATAPRS
jgi:hypothetical protein